MRTTHDTREQDGRLIRLHLDWLRRRGATESTIKYRRGVLTRLSGYLPCSLIEATAEDLDQWQAGLSVSLSSIASYTGHVRMFYRWCIEVGHIEIDPAARLPVPRIPQRKPRPIPDADLQVAIECAPEPIRTWLLLAAGMGLRAMEVAGMRREDVNEVDGRMYLDGVGKGRKPFRLPIPPDVAVALRPYLHGASGPLWRTRPGELPSRPIDVTMQSRRFFERIGMPYSLHRARHSFGTSFYASTRDLLLTQQVMRHSSTNTTRGYVATADHAAEAAMDRLAAQRAKRARRRGAA